MPLRRQFRIRAVVALVLLSVTTLAFAATNTAEPLDPRASAPLELVITAHTTAEQRPALRKIMQTRGLQGYEQMKRDGILSSYRVLFSRYVDHEIWDLMTVLTFKDQAAAQRWKNVELETPAGLPAAALALVSKISTSPSDRIRSRSSNKPASAGDSVFVVLPYDYMVSTDAYIKYVDDYLVPQIDGWLHEGLLENYDVSIARYGSARHWASMLVLEYRNDAALGHRDAVMAKVRAHMAATDPTWNAASKNKKSIRIGRQYMIADELRTP